MKQLSTAHMYSTHIVNQTELLMVLNHLTEVTINAVRKVERIQAFKSFKWDLSTEKAYSQSIP